MSLSRLTTLEFQTVVRVGFGVTAGWREPTATIKSLVEG